MRNLFNFSGARIHLPRVTIAQRVIDKIVANAAVYATETGESLVGFVVATPDRSEPDIYVLDTIPPDETAIREGAFFEQGDDLQGDIFNWLYDNWELVRERRRGLYGTAAGARWDVPLAHLGDWHKHPGHLVEPSLGDFDTARDQIYDREADTPQLLVILATIWSDNDQKPPIDFSESEIDELEEMAEVAGLTSDLDARTPDEISPPIKVALDGQRTVRIDTWYISRQIRRFVHLSPMVVPDADLPDLPPVGWHLLRPDRMRTEIDALAKEGYAVSIEQFDTDRVPPMEVCFSLAKRDASNILIVSTPVDFPETIPSVRISPMSAMKDLPQEAHLFDHLWKTSQPLPPDAYPSWVWTPDKTLLDLVRDIEGRLKEGTSL